MYLLFIAEAVEVRPSTEGNSSRLLASRQSVTSVGSVTRKGSSAASKVNESVSITPSLPLLYLIHWHVVSVISPLVE
jgi:hypothetical protein